MQIQNQTRVVEIQGIIVKARFKIEKVLKQRKAFDEKTATVAEEAKVNFRGVLDLIEKNGLIGGTPEGKI